MKQLRSGNGRSCRRQMMAERLAAGIALKVVIFAALGCQPIPRAEVLDHLARTEGRVSVSVRDIETGEGWDVRGNEPFVAGDSASVFVIAELFRQLEAGGVTLDERLPVTGGGSGLTSGPISRLGLLAALGSIREMSVRDLAVLALSRGDPTAVNVLIEYVGHDNINNTAQGLGAAHTRIERKLGYAAPPENYTTARDLALVWSVLTKGEAFSTGTRAALAEIIRASRGPGRLVDPSLAASDLRVTYDGDSPGRAALVHGSGVLYLPGRRLAVAVLAENQDSRLVGEELVAHISTIIHSRHEEEARRASQ